VAAILAHMPGRARELFVLDEARGLEAIVSAAEAGGASVQKRRRDALDALVPPGEQHQGVVLAAKPFPYVELDVLKEKAPDLVVFLDGLQDPRNLGAAARAALAFGAGGLVIPRDRAARVTAQAEKTAVGALAEIPVCQVANLRRALDSLKESGFWVAGAEADGDTHPWQMDFVGPTILVIGGEDRGLRRLTREGCDAVVRLPTRPEGPSLNAADALTTLLYEVARQRRKNHVAT
jgi:23S rRNA (guanosine2251-2'-O)-methyltransferase